MAKVVKVALCDDQALDRVIVRLYLEMYLSQKGLASDIVEFNSGSDFLRSDVENYTMVFMDIFMDGENGVETAKKALELNPDLKIMFCSSSPEFFREYQDMKAFGYFIKPLSLKKFSSTMDELVNTALD